MSSNSKTIFVTGVAGFLGSHLSEKLVSLGHKVIGIDNMLGGYDDNVPKNVEFHKIDCCDHDKIKSLMKYMCKSWESKIDPEECSILNPYFNLI